MVCFGDNWRCGRGPEMRRDEGGGESLNPHHGPGGGGQKQAEAQALLLVSEQHHLST